MQPLAPHRDQAQGPSTSLKQQLIMLGLMLSSRQRLREAEPFIQLLDRWVPQSDVRLWLKGSHALLQGRLSEAREMLQQSNLEEARLLLHQIRLFPLHSPSTKESL